MAREGYLIGADEINIHDNQIVADTPMKKWNNWWYYHKIHVVVIAIVAVTVAYFVHEAVTTVKPDYTIGLIGSTYISDENVAEMELQLAEYGVDLNGDGEVVVYISNMYIGSDSEYSISDESESSASLIQFIADFSTGDSVIWLMDDSAYIQIGDEEEQASAFEIIGDDGVSYKLDFNDVAAFEELEITSTYDSWSNEDYKQLTIAEYQVSIRSLEGFTESNQTKLAEYIDACYDLFDNLMTNTKTVTE